MSTETEVDACLQQLVARTQVWFEEPEVGDEYPHSTSNLLVVGLAGTGYDPHYVNGRGTGSIRANLG